ncbi:hypothetical protein BgiMline_012826, partial [Biomphalaria glabrata]
LSSLPRQVTLKVHPRPTGPRFCKNLTETLATLRMLRLNTIGADDLRYPDTVTPYCIRFEN